VVVASSSFLLAVVAVVAAVAYCLSMVERLELLPNMVSKTVVVGGGEP
jgi:hypothetical protein